MIAAPAIAGEENAGISVTYSDLNLNTEAGQKALENRVMAAAESVCDANTVRTGTRIRSNSERKCLVEAKKSAKQMAEFLADWATPDRCG